MSAVRFTFNCFFMFILNVSVSPQRVDHAGKFSTITLGKIHQHLVRAQQTLALVFEIARVNRKPRQCARQGQCVHPHCRQHKFHRQFANSRFDCFWRRLNAGRTISLAGPLDNLV